MQKDIVEHFRPLSYQEILAQRPGTWDDFNLLNAYQYFLDEGDSRRGAAVVELILRSPEHSEMVAYDELYHDLVNHERWSKNYPAALRWLHANLAYEEQHFPGANRANAVRDLAETYLHVGELDIGLTLFTRCLKANPADIWTYNGLALSLPDTGLTDLTLEILERALELVAEDDPEGLQKQLENLREEATEAKTEEKDRPPEPSPAVLADLRAAIQLSSAPPEDVDAYLPPVDGLISLEEDGGDILYEQIIAQGKVLAPDLIRIAFDETLSDMPASGHAVTLLRRMHADQVVELAELASWLEQAHGDWQRELLTEKAGKIGGHSTDDLVAIIADATYALHVRTAMTYGLAERAQKCPDQRELIVRELSSLLTRSEADDAAEETFVGFLISAIADMRIKELYPVIEAAYAEDRVDVSVIGLQEVQEIWEMPVTPSSGRREDGLHLQLRCKSCQRVREHFVEHVTIDYLSQERIAAGETVKYDPHIMDRQIICPKCGARDHYELMPLSLMSLLFSREGGFGALFDDQGEKPEWPAKSRVNRVGSVVFDRPMHPLEGLDEYKRLIAADPQNVSLYMRMGSLLRVIHRYPSALEAFRKGYEQGTDNPEDAINRAMAEHDFGDRNAARQLYQETIRLAARQPGDPYMRDLIETAHHGQELLNRGGASPWESEMIEEERAAKPKPSWHIQRKKRRRPKKKRR